MSQAKVPQGFTNDIILSHIFPKLGQSPALFKIGTSIKVGFAHHAGRDTNTVDAQDP
ncbi:hypothetical protein RO3G_01767 [Rhizopus delemar RA 99-880]|uniref:Uncharacterized protein n=1 Tax=Rhizopus delemar (strain RA 99-880 / ATCC MYA-4621 / FGSC 9543 / NRRL 43880) TaxID=246409 RepID=I1BLI3_RHIO9|nr:hypothetical protein RO3G_01767 [Rhizopus delemar RA 99-880]|eukprot:EIE77063.1 hypothetical protein RO3G_01767 [Rhizopus delemar RA 99-880]